MESLFAIVQQWVSSGSIWLAAGGSFVGGALTALNPCVIVMVPLLIGFIGGMDEEMTAWKSFLFTLVFIVGFSVELAVLFTVGLAAAPFLQSEDMAYVVAVICILLGLHFMDIFHIQLPISQDKLPKHTGFLGPLFSVSCSGWFLSLHGTSFVSYSQCHPAERRFVWWRNDVVLRCRSLHAYPGSRDICGRCQASHQFHANACR